MREITVEELIKKFKNESSTPVETIDTAMSAELVKEKIKDKKIDKKDFSKYSNRVKVAILVVYVLVIQWLINTNFFKAYISKFISNPATAKLVVYSIFLITVIVLFFLLIKS